MTEPIISAARFKNAREQSDDIWSAYEVFDEERDYVDLRELVIEIVEGQLIHPQGHNMYELNESVDTLIVDKVYHTEFVPDEIPDAVKQEFSNKLISSTKEPARELYKNVRDDADDLIDTEGTGIGDLQSLIEKRADELNLPKRF